ncbi:aminotransferase class I/II-fold pyridoxal phosphate-dependent enzyme [bacterium]|nr:aminotransferase class I/II-fold pyridoxal phosphate-dependent enzyme [Flavobacteriales bacterium]MDB2415681.1 aminotransferase class I/II-fold pyridoxal phosphate-dependent enzyme [bacterium]MDB2675296.1 aminotransferase class I/II-fold pyridoxal phosphate-dependent enzyme [Flavobacteriales bacterium]
MKKHKPADNIQDIQYFGEYGGVNPSIADSSTFTYMAGKTMEMVFGGEREGCYLYSRHMNPSTGYLAEAIAQMENTEAAHVSASGMGSISSTILQICKSGDHIISSRTIYGGTYAFMKNFLPKLQIDTSFVDTTNLDAVKSSITKNTKIIYCETVSNPLLEVSDIKKLSEIAKQHNLKLVVDNTFTPLVFSPKELGADIVIHSLTKFINGASDTLGGVICSDKEFMGQLIDVNDGAAMLLGPTMDAIRANGILKNLRTLPVRIKQHSYNANYLAHKFEELGLKVHYPGLKSHPQHELMKASMNQEFGFGGMLVLDVENMENAYEVMEEMQNQNIGYLAVSLGFYKTLFSAPGASTSSEIPEDEQDEMGISQGMIRMSIGLDNDIERTLDKMISCLKKTKILS